MQASVADLKARLSAFLVQVRHGEEILVTDHGKPVARLIPYHARPGEYAECLQRMAKEGLVRLPKSPIPPAFSWPLPQVKSSHSVLDALLQEREEGW